MEKMKSGKIFGTVSVMVSVTLLSKILGLIRDMLLSANYGSSTEGIAYETASRLPTILFDFVIGGVITATFIPVFNGICVRKSREEAMKFANTYVNFILVVTALLTLAGILFARPLVSFLAPDITEEAAALSTVLTRITFPLVIFTGLAFSFVGILQSLGEYNIPALISLVSNSVIVLYFIFLNKRFGIYGLSVTMVIAWAMQAAVQIPKAHALGYRFRPTLHFRTDGMREVAAMGLPILACSWMTPLCNVINTRFASGIEEGRAITGIGYSNRLYLIIVGVFSFVATNLLFPYLSRAAAEGDKKTAREFGGGALKLLLFVILPISAGLFVFAEPIVKMIYMRGEFGETDVALTSAALRCFAVGMPGAAANEVFLKVFFSNKKPKIPMMVSLASVALDLLLVWSLTGKYGISGIALASGIAVTVCAAVNYVFLVRSGDGMLSRRDAFQLLYNLACSAIMAVCCNFIFKALGSGMGYIPAMLISVAAGVVIYFVLSLIIPTDEVRKILHFGKGSEK